MTRKDHEWSQETGKDLIDWTDGITREVQDIVEKYPLEIKPPNQPLAAIDSENIENDKLPPPLQPQVYAGWSQFTWRVFIWA